MRIVDSKKILGQSFKKCTVCGKEFVAAAMHMYKIHNKTGGVDYQCSYSHYREAGGDNGKYNRQYK